MSGPDTGLPTSLQQEPSNEHEKVLKLASYIATGVAFMKNGEFQKALTHFENKIVARDQLGVGLEVGVLILGDKNTNGNDIIEQAAQKSNTTPIKNNSGISAQIKVVSIVPPLSNFGEPLETYHKDGQRIQENSVLLHAEEWIHALQYLNGGKNIFRDDQDIDAEQDVALYLHSQGVHLTDEFLNRYNRREAIERIFPSQNP